MQKIGLGENKPMMMDRAAILDDLATRITQFLPGRILRIAIDGRTASGKTTLSDEIAASIESKGRGVIRTSIDGFHRPKTERYARGRYSAEGYYYDARDISAVREMLLDPLGPGGDRFYRTASFDLDNDRPIEQKPRLAQHDAVLVVDGTFLQRPELRGGWDLVIFVATSEAVSEARGLNRDMNRLGGKEAAQALYTQRYRAAFHLYEQLCSPHQQADVIFDNEDFEHPDMQIREGGRLVARCG